MIKYRKNTPLSCSTPLGMEYLNEIFTELNCTTNELFALIRCGHCQRLKPTWEELATKLAAKEGEQVAIAQVDCTVDTELCSKQDVTGYPT